MAAKNTAKLFLRPLAAIMARGYDRDERGVGMPRGVSDFAALESADVRASKNTETSGGLPFNVTRIGHIVLKVRDLERSVAFQTGRHRDSGLSGLG